MKKFLSEIKNEATQLIDKSEDELVNKIDKIKKDLKYKKSYRNE
jgi:KaiC/GvpD/RAD55 family RecA-like ATPase